MDWLGSLFSWSGLLTLTFFWRVVLMIVAGAFYGAVMIATLRARLHPVNRGLVIVLASLFFGALLGKGLGLF